MAATFFYINDTSAQTWQVGVLDDGELTTSTVSSLTPAPVYTADLFSLASWQITISTSGELTTSLAPSATGATQQVLISSGGFVWKLGVVNTALFTYQGALLKPQIVYPSGGPNVVNFTQFPRFLPAYNGNAWQQSNYEAARIDGVTSSGAVESIYKRTDNFWEGTMEWVTLGDDINSWYAFKQYSLGGWQTMSQYAGSNGNFDLYMTQSSSAKTIFVDEDVEWKPEFKSVGVFTFPLKFRLWVQP